MKNNIVEGIRSIVHSYRHKCIGKGNGNPLQCSCLENPRDGGAWWAAVYGVAQSRTRLKRLSSSSTDINRVVMNTSLRKFHLSKDMELKEHFNKCESSEAGTGQEYLRNGRASQVVLVVKNPPTNAGDARDTGWILGLGRSPGIGTPLQYSCLENSMGRGAWQATVHRPQSQTQQSN